MKEATFFVEQQGTYLLSHSVGLPLKAARSSADQGFWEPWLRSDEYIWDHWLAGIERFRGQLGVLLNSDADHFCPQTNLSSAVGKVIFSLMPPEHKNVILMSEEDFPSLAYVLQQSQGLGYQMRYIPAGLNLNDMDVWDRYLTDDIALVLLTQVQPNNGTLLPVATVTALASQRSVLTLVDVAQSIGIIPIDIQKWSADFIVGSCVKWLSGGPGAGFLWVNPDILERCQPRDVGWFSHDNPFEFDVHSFRYAKNALRFWGGTPSVYPFLVATAGLEFANKVGVERMRQHNLTLCDRIIQGLGDDELMSPLNAHCRSGTLIIHFGEKHDQMIQSLRGEGVYFDTRSKGIRMSPHIYNSEAQIIALTRLIDNSR